MAKELWKSRPARLNQKMAFNVNKHVLVPVHTKLNDSDKKKLLEKFQVDAYSLPKIMKTDPAIAKLDVKAGDVIKIERLSKTAGIAFYYRVVVNG